MKNFEGDQPRKNKKRKRERGFKKYPARRWLENGKGTGGRGLVNDLAKERGGKTENDGKGETFGVRVSAGPQKDPKLASREDLLKANRWRVGGRAPKRERDVRGDAGDVRDSSALKEKTTDWKGSKLQP